MSALCVAKKAVQHKIDSCGEQVSAWTLDRETAQAVFRCDVLAGDMVESFDSITSLNERYTKLVVDNPAVYEESFDRELKDLFVHWIEIAESLSDLLSQYRSNGHTFDSETQFLERLDRAYAARAVDFDQPALDLIADAGLSVEELSRLAVPLSQWPKE